MATEPGASCTKLHSLLAFLALLSLSALGAIHAFFERLARDEFNRFRRGNLDRLAGTGMTAPSQ